MSIQSTICTNCEIHKVKLCDLNFLNVLALDAFFCVATFFHMPLPRCYTQHPLYISPSASPLLVSIPLLLNLCLVQLSRLLDSGESTFRNPIGQSVMSRLMCGVSVCVGSMPCGYIIVACNFSMTFVQLRFKLGTWSNRICVV